MDFNLQPQLVRITVAALLAACCMADGGQADEPPMAESTEAAAESSQKRLVQGRVVWLAEALAERYGIQSVPEAKSRMLAVQTKDGMLLPIAEDIRGRSLRVDKRLRDRASGFYVAQYPGSPVVQIIRLYERTAKGRFELDYWCEICAIAMFELKACDCCQGPIELRRRPLDSEGR